MIHLDYLVMDMCAIVGRVLSLGSWIASCLEFHMYSLDQK